MIRWRPLVPGLLLAGLVACGGTTAIAPTRSLNSPTATVAAAASSGAASSPAPRSSAPASATTSASTPSSGGAAGAATATAPRPSASAAASARATTTTPAAARTPAPSGTATAAPRPNGVIPAGWKTYVGPPEFPIAIAYPPDWIVDTSLFPEQAVIFIVGPEGGADNESVEIAIGPQQFDANIDVLRDEFFYRKTDFCDKTGIEFTEQRRYSDATFAILGATCDSSDTLTYIQAASGLKNADEWDFAMRTPYERKEQRRREVFDPMLASVNIYALITTR